MNYNKPINMNIKFIVFFLLINFCFINFSFAEEDCVNGAGDGIGKSYQQEILSRHDPVDRYKNTNNSEYITVEPGGNAGGVAADFAKLAHDKGIDVLVAYKGTGCTVAAVRTSAKYDGSRNYNFTDHYYDSRYAGMECNYRRVRLIGNQDTADEYCKLLGYNKGAASYSTAGTWWASEPLRAMVYYDKAAKKWKVDILTSRCTRGGIDKNYHHLAAIKCYGQKYECEKDTDCASGYKCEDHKCVEVKKGECEDKIDNDSDGLTDDKDLGCKDYDSTKNGKVVLKNDTAGRLINECKSFTMEQDGDVLVTLKDDDATVVVKRVEDQKNVIIAKTDRNYYSYGYWECKYGAAPINVVAANNRTAKYNTDAKVNNDAVHYDRNGNETAYFSPDGSRIVPSAAYSEETIPQRTVHLKKGDIVYLATRSDVTPAERNPNTVELVNGTANKAETLPYSYIDTDEDMGNDSIYVKGTVTFTKGAGSVSFTDTCEGNYVIEYKGSKNPKFSYSNGQIIPGDNIKEKISCPYGCYDGACKRQCEKDSDCQKGYQCISNQCVKGGECEDTIDNDNDGLIDLNDLGCKGYTPSGKGEVVLKNDTAKKLINECKSYTMQQDGKVLITLRDDDVTVVVKRVDDQQNVILAKSDRNYYSYGYWECKYGKDPINVKQANARTGKYDPQYKINNDAVHYDRNGNEIAYFPPDGSPVMPAAAYSDDTIPQRIVELKKGDIIYMATRSDLTPEERNQNTVELYGGSTPAGLTENLPYTYVDTDEKYGSDDIYVKGTTTFYKGPGSVAFTDKCSGDYLYEYRGTVTPKFTYSGGEVIPVEGSVVFKVKCDYGCVEGACKRQCTKDSDCQEGYKCENNKCVPKDECEDTKDNDGDGLIDKDDPTCKDGSCPSTGCKESYDYTCLGQTTPDYTKKTSITYSKGGKTAGKYTDSCLSDGRTLNEYVCVSKPNFSDPAKYGMSTKVCDKYCVGGACVECKTDADCPGDKKCINNQCVAKDECADGKDNDNDGLVDDKDPTCNPSSCPSSGCKESYDYTCKGQTTPDYTTKTSVTYSKAGKTVGTFEDACQSDGKTLDEYICVENPNFSESGINIKTSKTCEKYCANGACVECTKDTDCAEGMVCSNEHKCVDGRDEIIPTLECVMDNKDGRFTAYFGYENPNSEVVTIPAGSNDEANNKVNIVNDPSYTLQTSEFKPGRNKGTFYVVFDKDQKVVWKLKSSSKPTKEVEATANSTKCAQIYPKVDCKALNSDGTYKAHFGYENKNEFVIDIPVGIDNAMDPAPEDRGQPHLFEHGDIKAGALIDFKGSVSWNLNGTKVTIAEDDNTIWCDGGCVKTDISSAKANMNGDEFVENQKKQTALLLAEKDPYPLIRDIKASAKRRNNRTNKVNEQLKKLIATLPDVMLNCETNVCPLQDNSQTISLIKKRLKNLRRKVGRTIRQRNMNESKRKKLLNENTKLLNSKLEIVDTIPRFANVCLK